MGSAMGRRQLLAAMGWTGVGTFLARPAAAWARSQRPARLARAAASTAPAGSDLGAIEHIIFLMMENRSYDHYFGAYSQGRGFDDHPSTSLGNFAQSYPGAGGLVPADVLLPFHLASGAGEECTDDLTHDWGPQHLCWNGGKMDSFVAVHTSSRYEGSRGAMTMGYYRRQDLPFYWGLADAFTLCDAYHCSVLGPTHPNRLMANSGTIDPTGANGGPVTETSAASANLWSCTWPTMPEVLEDAGVSWKVYHPSNIGLPSEYRSLLAYPTWSPAFYDPYDNPQALGTSDNVLPYFKSFRDPSSALYRKAFGPTFPHDFLADVKSGALPKVSWLIPPIGFDEHPSSSPDNGMFFTSMVLSALVSNPAVWSKTALFVMYDENDGWFDHVPPPTAPAGTPGEYLTASPSSEREPGYQAEDLGIKGPIGLGVRVPCLVLSPFSRGGHIASEVFDHTSQLKLLASRFGVDVPNVSAWRLRTVGDLTSALFAGTYDPAAPALAQPKLPGQELFGTCSLWDQDTESGGAGPHVPTHQSMPNQRGGGTPVGAVILSDKAPSTTLAPGGRGQARSTTKSAYNRLAQPSSDGTQES